MILEVEIVLSATREKTSVTYITNQRLSVRYELAVPQVRFQHYYKFPPEKILDRTLRLMSVLECPKVDTFHVNVEQSSCLDRFQSLPQLFERQFKAINESTDDFQSSQEFTPQIPTTIPEFVSSEHKTDSTTKPKNGYVPLLKQYLETHPGHHPNFRPTTVKERTKVLNFVNSALGINLSWEEVQEITRDL